jgi:hypothetical protein
MNNIRTKTAQASKVAPAAKIEVDLKAEIALPARIVYPNLEQPDENGQYTALFIVDPESKGAQKLQALVAAHLNALYPNGVPKAGYWNPIRSGDEVKGDGSRAFKAPEFEAQLVFRAKTKFQPRIVSGPHRDPMDASDVRGGDHVIVAINCYGYRNQSTGVGISMNAIWWARPGETSIGGGSKGGSSFSDVDTDGVEFFSAE